MTGAFIAISRALRSGERALFGAQPLEYRQRALHAELARFRVVGFGAARHHVTVLNAGKDVDFHILVTRRDRPVRFEHRRRRLMVLIAPDDANRSGGAFELVDEVEHLRAVARHAGSISEAFGAENRVRAAVAEADGRSAAVELRQLFEFRE